MTHSDHVRVLAECQTHCTFVRSYVGLLTDSPHVVFEFTLTVVQDVVLGVLLWPRIRAFIKRRVSRDLHSDFDAAHGITHTYTTREGTHDDRGLTSSSR